MGAKGKTSQTKAALHLFIFNIEAIQKGISVPRVLCNKMFEV